MTAAPAGVGVIGVGYVGLVTATCFADLGHEVVCRDIDPKRVDDLKAGRVPIYEPGIDRLLERNRSRLTFTLDMEQVFRRCRVVFVCVDTPPTPSGDADLSRVHRVVAELPEGQERYVLVMKSTVPVGTGERVRAELDARGLTRVGYVSNPEFLREGRAITDFMEPDRIVIGAFDEGDGDAVAELYADVRAPIVRTDVSSAEMIKYASNAFLATKISFINEIANVCEEVGADVQVVAQGMGLDDRIGSHFLRPGIGYGGSCLPGDETVLVRLDGCERLTTLAELWRAAGDGDAGPAGLVAPADLEVWAWPPGAAAPAFLPASHLTRRRYRGELVEVRTKMGRRVRATPDHPFVVLDADGGLGAVREARELTESDWLPLAPAAGRAGGPAATFAVLDGLEAAGLRGDDVLVRPVPGEIEELRPGGRDRHRAVALLEHPRGARTRLADVTRTGVLRLDEARALGVDPAGARLATVRNGTWVPESIVADAAFWRIVGLYVAEGCVAADGRRRRISWSFHPSDEDHLVDEVAGYWRGLGVRADVRRLPTTTRVSISSRLLAGWWTGSLGLGRTSYEQRLPDAVWAASDDERIALLSGLWHGDGSWSLVAGGPSCVLEYGTVSRELADGVLRLLGDLGVVARLKVGRTAKSTRDTVWIVVSGADQVERLLEFVRPADRDAVAASLARQDKRTRPTGFRRSPAGVPRVRVTSVSRRPFAGDVYSVEVPAAGTFATSGGLVVHNCFPKDVRALKQLAGNSGYHFQLLTAVIEVNELQKRRVVGKLEKHLGSLRGRRIALLGLAFKANTDDMREASSIVLASRLLSEGASVVGYDPVARDAARRIIPEDVELVGSALEAVRGAHAAVVVTEWGEFRTLPSEEVREAMAFPLIVDGRNLLDPGPVRDAGFVYEAVGRPSIPADLAAAVGPA